MDNQKQTWIVIIALAVVLVFLLLFVGQNNDSSLLQGVSTDDQTETTDTPDTGSTGSAATRDTGSTGATGGIPAADELTVTYTDSGFSPYILEVNAGDTVDFVNRSSGTLWVTSHGHPTAPDQNYPEFDSGKSIPPGGTYSFMFTLPGTWGYKNLNNEKHLGAIVVNPQKGY